MPAEARSRRSSGFTLLEILLATLLTTLLVVIATQGVVGIQRKVEDLLGSGDRSLAAQMLLDRVERELLGTVLVVKAEGDDRLAHPYLFIGDDRVFGAGDSDALRFITTSPARPPGQPLAAIRMITYAVAPRADDGVDLVRQEDAMPLELAAEVRADEGQVVAEQLALFNLRYLNDESGEWEERWDSTDIARLDRLPTSVEVSVQLLEQEQDEVVAGELFVRLVDLPIRPIDPTADAEDAEDGGEEAGDEQGEGEPDSDPDSGVLDGDRGDRSRLGRDDAEAPEPEELDPNGQ